METRVFALDNVEFRADGDKLRFRGHAAVFDQLSEDLHGFREKVARGAFTKTLKEADVRFLVNHNPDLVLARSKNQTLSLSEDETGLLTEAEMAPVSYARDVSKLLERGDVDQMSFGFQTLKDEWDESGETPVRTLKEVRLWDVSVVTFPAYPQTDAEVRTVVPFQDLPLASRERAWDASEAESRWRSASGSEEDPSGDYRRAFLWYDRENSDNFGSYKLQIADVVDGRLTAIPRGVFAAAAVLQGGRGGVDIPESDMPRVRSHAGRYYAKMRREFEDDSIVPPWEADRALRYLAALDPDQYQMFFGELRDGTLSDEHTELVSRMVDSLSSLLPVEEPTAPDRAVLARRLDFTQEPYWLRELTDELTA